MDALSTSELLKLAREAMAKGDLEDAKNLAMRACENEPGSVDGWLLLGSIHGQLQVYENAIRNFRTAVNLAPTSGRGYLGLANALYAAGRLQDAIKVCRQLIDIEPVNAEHWYLLATIAWLHGDIDESTSCLHRVIELAPTHAMAHRSLGYLLQSQGRLEEALNCYRRFLEYRPDDPGACNDIGVVLQELGRAEEAVAQYSKALRIRPDFIDANINLGALLLTLFSVEEAERCFRSVLAVDRGNTRALCGLGTVLQEQGKNDAAHASFSKALALDPNFEGAVVKLARLYERQGDYEKALSMLQPLVDSGDNADAAAAFALLALRVNQGERAISVLESMLERGVPTRALRLEMHFSLGRLYDRQGEYAAAYRNFAAGNSLKAVDYNLSDHDHMIHSLIDTYNRESIAGLKMAVISDRQPIFVVGMPRSGTSLAEQILSVHPDVQAAGELAAINRIAAMLHQVVPQGRPYPGGAPHLSSGSLERLKKQYLEELPEEGRQKAFFTDKMPHNFLHLGFIKQLFPNARIVHCVRDVRDTCFSCYTYDFNGEHPYAYDLETLGEYFLRYRRLMKHWEDVLEMPIYNLSYERLISDQEQEIRKLIGFCGLEWNERCLEFHESRRLVLTSSYDQVRRPIYSSSVGRWKHYERHIQPLIRILERELGAEMSGSQ